MFSFLTRDWQVFANPDEFGVSLTLAIDGSDDIVVDAFELDHDSLADLGRIDRRAGRTVDAVCRVFDCHSSQVSEGVLRSALVRVVGSSVPYLVEDVRSQVGGVYRVTLVPADSGVSIRGPEWFKS